jgi:RHS repeat-associated protein
MVPLLFIEYDSVDADPAAGKRYFVFTNHISAPIRVEDESGRVVWRARLDAYGSAHISNDSTIEMPLRLPGHYFDAETGLHYNRFRYYSPELGRYIQSDPFGVAGGTNLYSYTSNPLKYVDVRGDNCPGGPAEPHEEEGGSVQGGADKENDEGKRPGQKPLTREEGQKIVDDLHNALPEKARDLSVTTLSETENGTLIVTNSDSVKPKMREAAEGMQQPGGPLEGRDVRTNGNTRGHPDNIPPAERNLPNAPNPDRASDGEQRGVQAANVYNGRGDENGGVTRQWSSGGAEHGGAACRDCETVQRQNGITNETGYQSQGGRYDRGGQEPDWNGVADPNYQPPSAG